MKKEQIAARTTKAIRASPAPIKPLTPAQLRKQNRLLQKRQVAKSIRERHKSHQIQLESQVNQLTSELSHLRNIQSSASPAVLDTAFREELLSFLGKLGLLVGNAEAKEREIEGVLREWSDRSGLGGERRDVLLRETFRRTVEMMIPGHIVQALALCDIATLPEFQSLQQAFPLSPAQQLAFNQCEALLQAEQPALQEALNSFKAVADSIYQHTQALQAMLLGFLPVLRPRQIAHLALWFSGKYASLPVEKVLNYGHCVTEMLNCS